MKKSILLFGIALAAVSCNINDPKPFDDADAFAQFSSAKVSVAENGGKVSVPVHLTSLNGVATSVSYTVKDGTAKQGTNFNVSNGGTGVLNFAAGETEKTIDFDVIELPGVFTGDLSFTVELSSAGEVNLGAATTATVTITDLDHPLSKILGTYNCTVAEDYWGDSYDWSIVLEKDSDDVTMVWIYNLDPYLHQNNFHGPIYGIVNSDMTSITVPQGQNAGVGTYAYYGADSAWNDIDITFSITEEDGKVVLTNDCMYYTSNGTYSGAVIYAGEKFIKQ